MTTSDSNNDGLPMVDDGVPPNVTICRRYDFEAAHFLPNVPDGHKCKRMHGHSYALEVFITGPVQREGPEAGMILDFSTLDGGWRELHALIDHRPLNEVNPNPTVENMAPQFWLFWQTYLRGVGALESPLAVRVILHEGPRSVCAYPPLR